MTLSYLNSFIISIDILYDLSPFTFVPLHYPFTGSQPPPSITNIKSLPGSVFYCDLVWLTSLPTISSVYVLLFQVLYSVSRTFPRLHHRITYINLLLIHRHTLFSLLPLWLTSTTRSWLSLSENASKRMKPYFRPKIKKCTFLQWPYETDPFIRLRNGPFRSTSLNPKFC